MNHRTYNQTVPPVLIYFLLINQICWLILEFMHLYILIVITTLFTLALILIFLSPPPSPPRAPPPYQRLMWDYKKADSKKMRKVHDLVKWERLFSNKDINTEVSILN